MEDLSNQVRWSSIAGRISGQTDNEIINYWNTHLSKKTNHKTLHVTTLRKYDKVPDTNFKAAVLEEDYGVKWDIGDTSISFNAKADAPEEECKMGQRVDEFFHFLAEETYGLDWVKKILELEDNDLTLSN